MAQHLPGRLAALTPIGRFLVGSRADWHLRRPSRPRIRFGLHLLGPLAVLLTLIASWPAFAGATGDEGSVALGLWVGAVSILLMSWSFVLALRPAVLEPLFGGLDSMYRVHRWAGALAVVSMFLHTSIEPEIEGGIKGAGKALADGAEDLAGAGELMLYGLVGLSLIRLFPYRWWRLTHKLLGVPYAFACLHFFTAEKPYGNGSAWGWWFGSWMVAGGLAFLGRVVVRDWLAPGRRYRVAAAEHGESTTRIELEPLGRPLEQRAGQFAFVKLGLPGRREPHPFSIASSPERPNLEFYIRHLGDWTKRLPEADLVGRQVTVEGPYGTFEPLGRPGQPTVWIAGGVGITPFLSVLDAPADAEAVSSTGRPPTLLYAVRDVIGNPIVARLQRAHEQGLVDLHLFTGTTGRLTPAALDRLFPDGLPGAHVALCGPAGLVSTMAGAAAGRGAASIETEDFDIRQGFGPDRSVEIALLFDALRTGRPEKLAELKQRLFDPADVVAAGADGVADQGSELVER